MYIRERAKLYHFYLKRQHRKAKPDLPNSDRHNMLDEMFRFGQEMPANQQKDNP